jgi:hypothetical protein
MIKLYHGSNMLISKPDLQLCKPYKDFGKGFYLSADRKQAQLLAEQRTRQTLEGRPVVNEFEFAEMLMTSGELKVITFNDYSEEWVRFILANRDIHHAQPVHDYDIVYGPIADDSVSFQLRRYQRGVISTIKELIQELRYSKGITFQYYFGTQKALDKLIRI